MKILIDLTGLYDHLTGVERYAKELAKKIIYYYPKNRYVLLFKNEIHDEFVNCDAEKIVLKGTNKLIFSQLTLPLALYGINADVYLFLAFPEPLLFFKKNIYTAVHDVSYFDVGFNMPFVSRLYYRLSFIHTCIFAKSIITISRFSAKRICSVAHRIIPFILRRIKDKIKIVYCGVELEEAELETKHLKTKYNLPNDYILSLSTIEPRKNIKLLLKAYSELISEGKELPALVLAGRNGWMMDEDIKLYEGILKDKLIFTGFVEDTDLALLYSEASLFVFPSMYEGFGMPPLEALCQGTRVLSSDAEALKEVLGDNALYFKNGDLADLKEKLEKLGNIKDKVGYYLPMKYTWDYNARRLYKYLRGN